MPAERTASRCRNGPPARDVRSGGAGGFLGGGGAGGALGRNCPKGVTRAQYEAAMKKCGGGNFGHGGAARFKSPAFKAALAKFATCMRQNGVNVPAPNTSGNGPVFDTKGIDTSSSQFKAAEAKCQSDLSSAFRRGPGAGGGAGGLPELVARPLERRRPAAAKPRAAQPVRHRPGNGATN